MKRTKIIATLGPSTIGRVTELIDAGMDVARINFSHGTDEERRRMVEEVRAASKSAGRPVGLLADLSGPKVRLGDLEVEEVVLETGQVFELTQGRGIGNSSRSDTDHPALHESVIPGDHILIADGAAELRVLSVDGSVTTTVTSGGTIRSHAGVNIPAERLSLPALTSKDEADLDAALEMEADFIAQSFVRSADDVRMLRDRLGSHDVKLIAKIETRPAVESFEEIAAVADGIIVARGDLGVEIAYEEIPIIQKELLRRAGERGIATVVATQMLESMVHSPRPTRAETSDVANAVLDATDAIMLSAETAIGSYPPLAVAAAARTAMIAEQKGTQHQWDRRRPPPTSDAESIALSAALMVSRDPRIRAIACFTRSGLTAELLSAVRPKVPIFAFSDGPTVCRSLTMRRAVIPFASETPTNTEELVAAMDHGITERQLVPEGELVLMIAATPVGIARTNLIKAHRVGSA